MQDSMSSCGTQWAACTSAVGWLLGFILGGLGLQWQQRGGSIPLCFFAVLASSRYGAPGAHGIYSAVNAFPRSAWSSPTGGGGDGNTTPGRSTHPFSPCWEGCGRQLVPAVSPSIGLRSAPPIRTPAQCHAPIPRRESRPVLAARTAGTRATCALGSRGHPLRRSPARFSVPTAACVRPQCTRRFARAPTPAAKRCAPCVCTPTAVPRRRRRQQDPKIPGGPPPAPGAGGAAARAATYTPPPPEGRRRRLGPKPPGGCKASMTVTGTAYTRCPSAGIHCGHLSQPAPRQECHTRPEPPPFPSSCPV